ncbi:MAG: YihA family ribosome biogenesis GTP-binding protein [Gammaproteobacteria bacterium]|nr:YihA family ribosome biogenesis GTP-binding protein [Gammaproteobacteria bacterium]
MKSYYQRASFLKSAALLSQLPEDVGIEVAFAGRSNAGKSSVLNVLTQQKGLARTSKTPGRTQLINLFGLEEGRRLVDLPGYGYAAVPEEVKLRWQKTLHRYLEDRNSLKGLVLVMDVRHPLKPFDAAMVEWARQGELPIHILLNKADKLSKSQAIQTLKQVTAALSTNPFATVQLFSTLTREGLDEFIQKLDHWFLV